MKLIIRTTCRKAAQQATPIEIPAGIKMLASACAAGDTPDLARAIVEDCLDQHSQLRMYKLSLHNRIELLPQADCLYVPINGTMVDVVTREKLQSYTYLYRHVYPIGKVIPGNDDSECLRTATTKHDVLVIQGNKKAWWEKTPACNLLVVTQLAKEMYEVRRRFEARAMDNKVPYEKRLEQVPLEVLEMGSYHAIACYLGYTREIVTLGLRAANFTLQDLKKKAKTLRELNHKK